MHPDDPFRLALLVLLGVAFPIGAYHRIRSQSTGEKLDRRQEGLVILVALRLLGVVFFISLVAFLVEPAWIAWAALDLPAPIRWAGLVPAALGVALVAWTFHHLGRNLTDTVVTRKEHTLVTTGPYRHVRHPFYLAAMFLGLGISLMTANWLFLCVGGLAFTLLVIRTRTEEAKLVERFGDAYRQYAARTNRHFPRLTGPARGPGPRP